MSAHGKRLLLVDDEADNREVFATILQHTGFDVSVAEDGPEALRLVASGAPDLVLLDISLPGISGFEVVQHLQRSHPELPVVAITAHDFDDQRLRDSGFCAYVRKPVAPRQLVDAVETCLDGIGRGLPWIPIKSDMTLDGGV